MYSKMILSRLVYDNFACQRLQFIHDIMAIFTAREQSAQWSLLTDNKAMLCVPGHGGLSVQFRAWKIGQIWLVTLSCVENGHFSSSAEI